MIENIRELRSIANTLQECRFTCIRSADDEDSEVTNAIEVFFDFGRIQMKPLFVGAWGDVCHHVIIDTGLRSLK